MITQGQRRNHARIRPGTVEDAVKWQKSVLREMGLPWVVFNAQQVARDFTKDPVPTFLSLLRLGWQLRDFEIVKEGEE